MAIHATRSTQIKPKSSSFKRTQSQHGVFQLSDKREESIAHQRFQGMADNSPQSMDLNSLQNVANEKKNSFFHAIAGASTPGTLEDINIAGGNLPGTPTLDLGTTSRPQNAVAPDFQVQLIPIHRNPHRFRARVIKTQDADEGDVNAMHVKSGTYYTNYRWIPDNELANHGMNQQTNANLRVTTLVAMMNAIDWDHVYMNVSGSISRLSRDAEQEHLNDTRHAYDISIGALDQAINTIVAQMPQNGYQPDGGEGYKSQQSARNDMFGKINQLLPNGSRGHISANQNTWLNDYLNLTQMTQNRDNQGWHSFELRKSGFWHNNLLLKSVTELWDIYAEHPETTVQYVDAITGPQININTVPSATVIHF
jgi:hypothetical protein